MGEQIKLLYDLFKINSVAFYSELLRLDFAIWVFTLTALISLLLVVLYYYVIDRPKTAKLSIWLLFLFINALILSLMAYVIGSNTIVNDYLLTSGEVPDYSIDYIYFSIVNFLFAALFFLLWSSIVKWKSSNSSHIPF